MWFVLSSTRSQSRGLWNNPVGGGDDVSAGYQHQPEVYLCGLHGRGRGGGSYRAQFVRLYSSRNATANGSRNRQMPRYVSGFRLLQEDCRSDVQGVLEKSCGWSGGRKAIANNSTGCGGDEEAVILRIIHWPHAA